MDIADLYLYDLKTKFEKINPKEYYLSYSGGRDSHFLYWFIKEYLHWDDIRIVGINTYMEHHEILDRIRKNCDIVLFPKLKPFEIKEKYGIPCFSKEQDFYIYYYQNALRKGKQPAKTILQKIDGTYDKGFNGISQKARKYVKSGNAHKITHMCCHFLKKEPARRFERETGLKPILGVRASESSLRKTQYKSCFTKDKKFTPIWDLTDEILSAIEKKCGIDVPEVYNNIKRTGCMACPYGTYKFDTQKELMLINDKQFDFVTEYFKESYEALGVCVQAIEEVRKNK